MRAAAAAAAVLVVVLVAVVVVVVEEEEEEDVLEKSWIRVRVRVLGSSLLGGSLRHLPGGRAIEKSPGRDIKTRYS